MAKDGTNRGGRRIRAGDKPDSLVDKIAAGRKAEVITFEGEELNAGSLGDAADLLGADMPNPSEYLSARQRDGKPLRRRSLGISSAKKRSAPMACWASTRQPAVRLLAPSYK